jgi:hypothetical protein
LFGRPESCTNTSVDDITVFESDSQSESLTPVLYRTKWGGERSVPAGHKALQLSITESDQQTGPRDKQVALQFNQMTLRYNAGPQWLFELVDFFSGENNEESESESSQNTAEPADTKCTQLTRIVLSIVDTNIDYTPNCDDGGVAGRVVLRIGNFELATCFVSGALTHAYKFTVRDILIFACNENPDFTFENQSVCGAADFLQVTPSSGQAGVRAKSAQEYLEFCGCVQLGSLDLLEAFQQVSSDVTGADSQPLTSVDVTCSVLRLYTCADSAATLIELFSQWWLEYAGDDSLESAGTTVVGSTSEACSSTSATPPPARDHQPVDSILAGIEENAFGFGSTGVSQEVVVPDDEATVEIDVNKSCIQQSTAREPETEQAWSQPEETGVPHTRSNEEDGSALAFVINDDYCSGGGNDGADQERIQQDLAADWGDQANDQQSARWIPAPVVEDEDSKWSTYEPFDDEDQTPEEQVTQTSSLIAPAPETDSQQYEDAPDCEDSMHVRAALPAPARSWWGESPQAVEIELDAMAPSAGGDAAADEPSPLASSMLIEVADGRQIEFELEVNTPLQRELTNMLIASTIEETQDETQEDETAHWFEPPEDSQESKICPHHFQIPLESGQGNLFGLHEAKQLMQSGRVLLRFVLQDLSIKWRLFGGTDWKQATQRRPDEDQRGGPEHHQPSAPPRSNALLDELLDDYKPAASGGARDAAPNTPRGHSRNARNLNDVLDIRLMHMQIRFEQFDEGQEVASHIVAAIRDIEIEDCIRASQIRSLVGFWDSDEHQRVDGTSMLWLHLVSVRPGGGSQCEEQRFSAEFLPMRINIDQEAASFIETFSSCLSANLSDGAAIPANAEAETSNLGGTCNVSSSMASHAQSASGWFFQSVDVRACKLKVDYQPHYKVSYDDVRKGNYLELLKLVKLEGMELVLQRVKITGVDGWGRVAEDLAASWTRDIYRKQLHKCVAGVSMPPFRPIINVGSGAADLLMIPVEQYKRDGRIVRGLRRGAYSFLSAAAVETLSAAYKVAVGAQTVLKAADDLVSGPHAGSPCFYVLRGATLRPAIGATGALSRAINGVRSSVNPKVSHDMDTKFKER